MSLARFLARCTRRQGRALIITRCRSSSRAASTTPRAGSSRGPQGLLARRRHRACSPSRAPRAPAGLGLGRGVRELFFALAFPMLGLAGRRRRSGFLVFVDHLAVVPRLPWSARSRRRRPRSRGARAVSKHAGASRRRRAGASGDLRRNRRQPAWRAARSGRSGRCGTSRARAPPLHRSSESPRPPASPPGRRAVDPHGRRDVPGVRGGTIGWCSTVTAGDPRPQPARFPGQGRRCPGRCWRSSSCPRPAGRSSWRGAKHAVYRLDDPLGPAVMTLAVTRVPLCRGGRRPAWSAMWARDRGQVPRRDHGGRGLGRDRAAGVRRGGWRSRARRGDPPRTVTGSSSRSTAAQACARWARFDAVEVQGIRVPGEQESRSIRPARSWPGATRAGAVIAQGWAVASYKEISLVAAAAACRLAEAAICSSTSHVGQRRASIRRRDSVALRIPRSGVRSDVGARGCGIGGLPACCSVRRRAGG